MQGVKKIIVTEEKHNFLTFVRIHATNLKLNVLFAIGWWLAHLSDTYIIMIKDSLWVQYGLNNLASTEIAVSKPTNGDIQHEAHNFGIPGQVKMNQNLNLRPLIGTTYI